MRSSSSTTTTRGSVSIVPPNNNAAPRGTRREGNDDVRGGRHRFEPRRTVRPPSDALRTLADGLDIAIDASLRRREQPDELALDVQTFGECLERLRHARLRRRQA